MEAPDALGWTNERAHRKWWFFPDMSDLGCRRKKRGRSCQVGENRGGEVHAEKGKKMERQRTRWLWKVIKGSRVLSPCESEIE